MAFNRLDHIRSSYHGLERRGRSFFNKKSLGPNQSSGDLGPSPLSSPLFRRKQFSFRSDDSCQSGPPSMCSSRDSSLDRSGLNAPMHFHDVVERVRGSPKLTLKQRLQVIRSGSFNDVSKMESKRKRWLLGRSESLRVHESLDTLDRRGSLPPMPPSHVNHGFSSPIRERSLDRVQRMERRGGLRYTQSLRGEEEMEAGKVKGFVHR